MLAGGSVVPPLNVLIGQGRTVDSAVSIVYHGQEVIYKCVYQLSALIRSKSQPPLPVIDRGGMACNIFSTASETVFSAGESLRGQP